MKKRNFKVLALKKYSISNLNMLSRYGGQEGEVGSVGSMTIPFLPTMMSCEDTDGCETNDPITCQTTGTLADNTLDDTCGCNAFMTMGC